MAILRSRWAHGETHHNVYKELSGCRGTRLVRVDEGDELVPAPEAPEAVPIDVLLRELPAGVRVQLSVKSAMQQAQHSLELLNLI